MQLSVLSSRFSFLTFLVALGCGIATPLTAAEVNAVPQSEWARGIEGQRKADLGNGTYLNPVLAGDRPDPSILKDGDDYYAVFSTFDCYPGLTLWHSLDLVNWQPIGPTLFKNVGPVWAPDIVRHGKRYFIYFPAKLGSRQSNYVIWADNIRGPWSDPIDLNIGMIDPGHAVGEDGRRYLFMSGGLRHDLSADGLSVTSEGVKVYDGWDFPSEWVASGKMVEGPKIVRHGEFYYMLVAEGGTAGPATGHMIVVSRSRSIDGPWENSPYNPLVRTKTRAEKWWSKGHGTLFEGPDARWYVIYHAYENGYYTLGRQAMLEPVEWTADNWPRVASADAAKPIPMPRVDGNRPHGYPLSDDFSTNKFGLQWSFFNGDESDMQRIRYADGGIVVRGEGTSPRNSSPLVFVCGDQAYEIEAEVEVRGNATGGLLLFYDHRFFSGFGFSQSNQFFHRADVDRKLAKLGDTGRRQFIKLVNDHQDLIIYTSHDGQLWKKFESSSEVSGYHHNTAGGFLSLRPALYAAGDGEVVFRNLKYRALP